MQLPFGIALLLGEVGALLAARPKDGKPRFIMNTSLETPIVIGLIMAICIGVVLTAHGIAETFL
jgi:hypothetical protein